jgi:cytochrome c5
MKRTALLFLVVVVAALLGGAHVGKQAVPEARRAPSSESRNDKSKNARAANGSRGADLFETHCGRCHNAPDELSPRVAPAVLAHMKTRAMLSREDEQEILRFLKP